MNKFTANLKSYQKSMESIDTEMSGLMSDALNAANDCINDVAAIAGFSDGYLYADLYSHYCAGGNLETWKEKFKYLED